ncbi:MAG: hypothetical protein UY20_C0001G0035 [Candidatus Yanofskybacteria bacterium GW2011_GWA1_48_10]|uniref:Transglutaminase-like domain-containing protein n=2 Tax=Candidatus Yanofskyibacteriota TaxID=1752733 RepID=A0A0G1U7Y2_9BACT|nr:MAG: hypothetical protein UY20_C0001G0035 [Candidatus Yanofskybacteria bacterium GW2011_GWA1_48_10]OGN06604.1 MAG: hypothetical protein A2669_03095 [Candidatus Yanofskybacteria bacterium RIFCSPHIGHO2_01_FULL_48_25b]
MDKFNQREIKLIRKLNTPAKIQDFLNKIPINFEKDGQDTVKSPLMVIRKNSAHCIEGAILGAFILSLRGHKPLLMHLESARNDIDHVVAPFRLNGYWGALSKTNHAVLRYREPVYKSLRELAMSYFHEYFTDDGVKTMRSYSRPLNLNVFEKTWPVESENLWGINRELDKIKHYPVAPNRVLKKMRRAEGIEREAGKITEWEKP